MYVKFEGIKIHMQQTDLCHLNFELVDRGHSSTLYNRYIRWNVQLMPFDSLTDHTNNYKLFVCDQMFNKLTPLVPKETVCLLSMIQFSHLVIILTDESRNAKNFLHINLSVLNTINFFYLHSKIMHLYLFNYSNKNITYRNINQTKQLYNVKNLLPLLMPKCILQLPIAYSN